MPALIPSRLCRVALISVTLLHALTPMTAGIAFTAAAIGFTAAAVVASSDAEARPQVRDHRRWAKPKPPAGG